MKSFTTFYLSRVIGKKVFDANGEFIGVVKDLLVDSNYSFETTGKPFVSGIQLKQGKEAKCYSFQSFRITKGNGTIIVTCDKLAELSAESIENDLFLVQVILDKQIVDLYGHKLVRANDVRLVSLVEGTYVVAVDIGIEGLLRRIGIVKPLKALFSIFGKSVPSKFILWEEVEAIDYSNLNIKLSKSYSKLQTLHPSDLADIIEELDKKSRTNVFSQLDEEQAADVFEELNTEAQVHLIESLPIEKVADVLEKMPADEVADIMDALEDEKVELLLKEMEKDTSEEVRELLEYPDNTVGSIMSTDILCYKENETVEQVINDLRSKRPEPEELFSLFVTGENDELIASFSLRDLVLSLPEVKIGQIMRRSPVHLYDYLKVDDIAEIIDKYNMLAIPVLDKKGILQGMVVIGDVVEDLINKRRTNK
ncbi:MAG: CBS domain-containing protein [Mariniphaga sp.]